MTRDEAGKLVGYAVAAFPSFQDKSMQGTINLWAAIMADVEFKLAELAIFKILREKSFFPTPADIMKAVKSLAANNDAPPAELAWQEVQSQLNYYAKPNYTHPAISETVKVLGYARLCHSDNPVADRAHFLKIYETIAERKKSENENKTVFRLVYKRDPRENEPGYYAPQAIGDIMKQIAPESGESVK